MSIMSNDITNTKPWRMARRMCRIQNGGGAVHSFD